ncbi:hypothetical protein QYE76_021829 [Lolium multiflorum]|uniref:Uncharacterized protein n=1 Tax=Lolium multiflorum TaxID=4521 RepID=A0AAD8R8G3_LOLMU|nr:hypothetical protein QYE76_021829 [Lolium multiflorum]
MAPRTKLLKHKAPGTDAPVEKARVSGWERSKISDQDQKMPKKLGLLKKQESLKFPRDESFPHPPIGFWVSFIDFLIRGLSTPIHEFLRCLLFIYGIQLHTARYTSHPSGSPSSPNPSNKIFSELDEINAQGPIFARSFQKTEEGRKWATSAVTRAARPRPRRADLWCGALVWPPRCPFAYLKPPSRNPSTEPRYGKPSRDAAPRSHLGIQEIASHPEDSSPGGLFIAMIASGVMSE